MKLRKLVWMALAAVFCTAMALFSCKKSGGGNDTPANNGPDSVLINLGTNIILPSFQKLAGSTATMDAAITAFNAAPSATTLTAAQNAFKDAYKAWEACSEFQFGPMADASLTTHFVNSFPTDTAVIKSNIGGASYAIDGISNYAAQGFPALDYMLFAYDNASVLARFTTAATATGAKQYMAAVSASLKTKSSSVANAWAASGSNYLAKFTAATGVDAGSSLSLLLNAFVQDFDVTLQNYKIGIPIGIYGPSALPKSPAKVEAYYSGYSVALLIAQVQAMQNIYLGGTGYGMDDKVAATKAQSNGLSLNDAIKNQINAVLAKLQALPDPLSAGIQSNNTAVNDAYTEVRKLTVLLKADMSSALGIKISFQDDDGD